jgi:hypothetical protein
MESFTVIRILVDITLGSGVRGAGGFSGGRSSGCSGACERASGPIP